MASLPGRCPTCDGALLPESRFCSHCGRGLGLPLPELHEAYTPRHLIQEVLGRRDVFEGERKLVTVLFLDLVDSVQHSASVGVERWHFALNGLFRLLADGVHRYGGIINQYTGDGIMALFGAPVSYEDHAQRACFSALYLRDRIGEYSDEAQPLLGEAFAVRMALHSGEVVVGPIGDELRMDYTAQGTVVGIAARLEGITTPDTIVVSGHTADLASGFVHTRSLGKQQLKGIETPIEAFALEGRGALDDRFSRSQTRGLSPFCGREEDFAWLKSILEEVEAGIPRLVGVQGDAGVGKSRLLCEFADHARNRGAQVFELRGVTHRQLTPYESTMPLLRGLLGVEPGEEFAEPALGRAPELVPFLNTLLCTGEDLGESEPAPDALERVLLRVLRRLAIERAEAAPLVVHLDDLDWLDAQSQRLLADLATSFLDAVPVLFVASQRENDPRSWSHHPRFRHLELEPLSPDEAGELAYHLLGERESIRPLAEALLHRCAGNPFFLEELVRSLAETGHLRGPPGAYTASDSDGKAELPETVQAVLSARIDRLSEVERRVLHSAAIVGREFTEDLVRELTELSAREVAGALHQLRLADFVEERWLETEATYYFRHPLVQEVAYRTQLALNRVAAHRRVAEILSLKHFDDEAVVARRAAPHWELAEEPLRAAKAWAQSAQLGSIADRVETWRRVSHQVALAGDGPDERALETTACAQRLSLGWHHGISPDESQALLERGCSVVAGHAQEPIARALLLTYYTRVMLSLEGGDAYVATARRAREEAAATQWDLLVDGVDALLTHGLLWSGRLEEGLAIADKTIPRLVAHQDARLQTAGFQSTPDLWVRATRAEILMLMDRPEARSLLESIVVEAEARGEVDLLVLPRLNLIRSSWLQGDRVDARKEAATALEAAHDRVSGNALVMAQAAVGMAALVAGDAEAAAQELGATIAMIRERRTATELEPLLETHLAAARLELGDAEGALAAAEAAAATSRERSLRIHECQAQIERAKASVALGRRADASAARSRCEALIEETGATALKRCLDRSRDST